VKINVIQIPPEGLILQEEISPKELDIETETVKFPEPVKITASVYRITNAVTVDLSLKAAYLTECSRCLKEVEIDIKKDVKLNCQVTPYDRFIDLNPDIREEIILEYPIKCLCKPDCKGICASCGKNLNEGKCSCKIKG
jgi:uncharacterized protein